MKKYYEIVPIIDSDYSMFDTISYIGEYANMNIDEIFSCLGFDCGTNSGSLLAMLLRKKVSLPYFGVDQYVINKLNMFCRDMNLPIRVTRSNRRKDIYGSISI